MLTHLFRACLFFLLIGLHACGPEYLYQGQQPIAGGQWMYRDSAVFRFQVPDTSTRYDFFLDIEYDEAYPFQNLYLRLSTDYPNGRRLSKVMSFDLFDTQGEVLGKSASGHSRLRTPLQENAYFNAAGQYSVTVAQHTRRDSLAGIKSIGLAVVRRKE
ncbi:MAG TPA: gliding motility lipoprotein GldH [Saprospiraceae bacterium]|nr:gliding motility lipoprotein GldH [Saprospiraceae bacterium]HND87089.1 gliding motility lipoprotein GldH [Saprospiraceae bacterium]